MGAAVHGEKAHGLFSVRKAKSTDAAGPAADGRVRIRPDGMDVSRVYDQGIAFFHMKDLQVHAVIRFPFRKIYQLRLIFVNVILEGPSLFFI